MAAQLSLRPMLPEDLEFLYRVYASTREDELAPLRWSQSEQEAFLHMQFTAQHTYYQQQFGSAHYQIIQMDGEPVGRLYLDYRTDSLHIIDIALLTPFRNQGIGTHFLSEILAEGEKRKLPVRLHVAFFNSAQRLYQRLGFREIGDNGVYWLMEWSPGLALDD
jgi:RimJ/RimL family protein N-acetyltransferase